MNTFENVVQLVSISDNPDLFQDHLDDLTETMEEAGFYRSGINPVGKFLEMDVLKPRILTLYDVYFLVKEEN